LQHAWRNVASLLTVGALVLGAAACGDDGDDETASASTETASEADGDETPSTSEAPAANPVCADLPPSEEVDPAATRTSVIAEDYEFFAVESLALGGKQSVSFINEGTEIHELVVVKVDDAETRPVAELLAEEEMPSTVQMIGFSVACPGERKVVNLDLSAPGRYVAVCNVPVGATPEEASEDMEGEPHHTRGMVAEFTVAAA